VLTGVIGLPLVIIGIVVSVVGLLNCILWVGSAIS
jgi:hypothetical protein